MSAERSIWVFVQRRCSEKSGRGHPFKRQDIDELILPKLPEVLSQKQKKAKIHNLLFELSVKMNKIKNIGSRKLSQWVLLKSNKK